MKLTIVILCICASSVLGFLGGPKKKCPDMVPMAMPPAPLTGRWYVIAATSVKNSESGRYRFGLFNNIFCQCEFLDFYSPAAYGSNVQSYMLDYSLNNGTQQFDLTEINYYQLSGSVHTNEKGLAIWVAETKSYYEDKAMHKSSVSSESSEEKKKRKELAKNGRYSFFFAALANDVQYKVLTVCSKFGHLTEGKRIVWVLSKDPTLAPQFKEMVKTTLGQKGINFWDKLIFVDHTGCKYTPPKPNHGGYGFVANP